MTTEPWHYLINCSVCGEHPHVNYGKWHEVTGWSVTCPLGHFQTYGQKTLLEACQSWFGFMARQSINKENNG